MCQSNSPPLKTCNCNCYILINEIPDFPDAKTPLIPAGPEPEPQSIVLINEVPKLHQAEEQKPLVPAGPEPKPQNVIHIDPTLAEGIAISKIAFPIILTGLMLYLRPLISMIFLGHLGELALAGGSLAIGFANITGYSVLSGLAMGMESICGQAYGAKRYSLLGLSLQRTILLLCFTSIPIAFLWLYMKQILLFFGQEESIAAEAQLYLLYSLPDLVVQSFLHPLRIYLRTQSITLPLTFSAIFSVLLHIPINYLLVSKLQLGIKGVALSGVFTNVNLVGLLVLYTIFSKVYEKTWGGISMECLKEWRSLLDLAIPSCISVCLEWWWYEIMILLCGLLINPRATVASMGILIQTTSLIYIFPSSLSFSVSTRVGNELGAERPKRAKLAANVGIAGAFLIGLSALTFSIFVRNIWAKMFTQDKEIVKLTSLVLPIIGLCELGNCPQTTGCGVLRGTARPKVGANINLGCFYLVGMPVAVGLAFYGGFDFKGLWMGLLAAQGSCAVTMLVVLARTNWEFESERAKKLTGAVAGGDSKDVSKEKSQLAKIKEDYSIDFEKPNNYSLV